VNAPAADRRVDVLQALGVLLALVEEGDALRVVRAAADVGQLDDVDPAAAVLVVELHDVLVPGGGGVTHTAPSKYHDEIISLVFIHTKYGEPIVIMDFRRAIQKALCLTPPPGGNAETDHVWRERAEVVLTRHQLASL
jgi:hypothetical protein